MFSKQHYVMVAKALAKAHPGEIPVGGPEYHAIVEQTRAWLAVRDELVDLFEDDNHAFDYNQFKKACNGNG